MEPCDCEVFATPEMAAGNVTPVAVNWDFRPVPCQRALDVSCIVGAGLNGQLIVAYRVRIQPTGNANEPGGERWMTLATPFLGPTAAVTALVYPSAALVLPAHVDGVRFVSTYDSVVTDLKATLYCNPAPECRPGACERYK